jgi:O-antigen ligase
MMNFSREQSKILIYNNQCSNSNFMLWMVIGYLFLFVFRPFEYWQLLGTLRIERIYMIIMLVMMIFSTKTRYVPHIINKAVVSFFLVMVIASIFAFNQGDAYIVTFDYFKIIVFYFVIIMTIRDSDDLKVFVAAYILIMFLYVGKSAWEFFVHDRFMWRMGIKRMGGIDSTYGDPNYFAASIAYSMPLWWALFKYRIEKGFVRNVIYAYPILAVVSIIYSGSRSGMLTALLFVFILVATSSKKYLAIVSMLLFLGGAWTFMPDTYKSRFLTSFSLEETDDFERRTQNWAAASARGRILGLQTGYTTFLEHPLLGVGPGNFKYAMIPGSDVHIGISAHNLYGQILGEVGGAGLITFIFFVLLIIKYHLSNGKRARELLLRNELSHEPRLKRHLQLFNLLSTASLQVLILLLFNGNFGHNLYRYNYLWIGAIAVIISHYMISFKKEIERVGF